MKTKTKQNDNLDMYYANCNAKNVRQVLVKHFDKNHTIMLSCDDKFIVKIGAPVFPLVLCPNAKAGWVGYEEEVIAADHDTVT